MSVFIDNSLMFLHVPKTGGSWITHILKNNVPRYQVFGNKHATYYDVVSGWEQHPNAPVPDPRPMYTAAFVRHPVSWYTSYWRFRGGEHGAIGIHGGPGWNTHYGRQHHILDPIDKCGHPNFETFVSNCLRDAPGFVSDMYEQYTEHADFVGRYENLAQDTDAMLCLAGLSIPAEIYSTPPINISTSTPPTYDGSLVANIEAAEAVAMRNWYQ